MVTLNPEQLQQVVNEDLYFAIPLSISNWVQQQGLNTTGVHLFSRMISEAIKKRVKGNGDICIQASISYLHKITGIKSRTISDQLNGLENKKLIQRLGSNDDGQVFKLNISSSITNNVHKRFKKQPQQQEAQSGTPPTHPSSADEQDTSLPCKSECAEDNSALVLKLDNKLDIVKRTITQIESRLNELYSKYDMHLSPIEMLKMATRNPDNHEKYKSNNYSEIDKLEGQISSLKVQMQNMIVHRERLAKPPEGNSNETHQVRNEEGASSKSRNYGKKSIKSFLGKSLGQSSDRTNSRYIRACDAKSLFTQIKNIWFLSKDTKSQMKYFKEILWTIRYGWYVNSNESTGKCIAHAIKILKSNGWKVSKEYNQKQIDGLVNYFGIVA